MGELHTVTVQFPSPAPTHGTDSAAAADLTDLWWTRAAHHPSKKGKYIFAKLLSIIEALGGWRHTRTRPRERERQVEKGARSNWGWKKVRKTEQSDSLGTTPFVISTQLHQFSSIIFQASFIHHNVTSWLLSILNSTTDQEPTGDRETSKELILWWWPAGCGLALIVPFLTAQTQFVFSTFSHSF